MDEKIAAKLAIGLIIWMVSTVAAIAQVLHVDSSTTIQQAIADAHGFPADRWVTILVAPGDYYGPVIVDRPRTRLIAESLPVLHNAKLTGHKPAVFVHPPGDPALGTIGVTVNDVEVNGFDVDAGGLFGVTAFGYPHDQPGEDDLLHEISGVQISGNVITNSFVAVYITQASAVVSGNTSVDGGGVGVVVTAGPVSLGGTNVTITGNVFNDKNFGANLVGAIDSIYEFPRTDGPAGLLNVTLSGNDLSGNSTGVNMGLRGAFPLSGKPGRLTAVIEGNRLSNNDTAGVSTASQQCYVTDVCSAGAPGSSIDALLINNDLRGTPTSAQFLFDLIDSDSTDLGLFVLDSRVRVRTVGDPLGEFAYDNAGGGNTLIVDGVAYTGVFGNTLFP